MVRVQCASHGTLRSLTSWGIADEASRGVAWRSRYDWPVDGFGCRQDDDDGQGGTVAHLSRLPPPTKGRRQDFTSICLGSAQYRDRAWRPDVADVGGED